MEVRKPTVRFGVFEIDLTSAELRKQGVKIKLQEQPFQVLGALIERRGQVVSRDERCKALWPDTVVDYDRSLNRAVNRLREALGDDAESPRFIETLPQRGYRFLAPVEAFPAEPDFPAPLPSPNTAPAGRSRRLVVAMLALGLAAGWLLGRTGRPSHDTPAAIFEISPPEGHAFEPAGTRQAFALSPDGKRLAFTTLNAAGVYSVWVRELGILEPRHVPDSEGAHNVFWSPDSVSLFSHVRGSLRRSVAAGGFHHVVSPLPARMFSGAWLSDDEILISGRDRELIVPASGGPGRPSAGRGRLWPQFLPGGKRVLYVELDKAAFEYQARVAAFDKPGDAHDVLRSDSRVLFARSPFREGEGYLYYVRAGNLLAQPVDSASLSLLGEPIPLASQVFTFLSTGAASFSVSREGTLAYQRVTRRSRIVWTDRTGREIAVVAPGELTVKYVRLSPDGKKIAASVYNVERGLNEIWILDADGRASRRAASGPGETDGPIWSPDSSSLAYVRAEGRPPQVFLQNVNEQGPEEALAPSGFQIPTDWSPDGRYVAYADTAFPHIENDQGGDVWLVDLKRNRTVVPILNTPFRESSALFAPNGKSLAFIADDSGKPEAYVQAFEGGDEPRLTGERKQVSRAGAVFLRWRPDGKELFYLASDSRVYAVSIGTAFGEPEALFTIPVASRAVLPTAFGFDVSGDGQRFLVAMAGAASPLTVVQNWEAAFTAGGQGKASKPNQE